MLRGDNSYIFFMPSGEQFLYFVYLYEREKKTKNPKKKLQNTKYKNIVKILLRICIYQFLKCLAAIVFSVFLWSFCFAVTYLMPRGDSYYVGLSFCTFFLCTKGAEFLLFFYVHYECKSWIYICWPVGAKVENYILITECMSFTKRKITRYNLLLVEKGVRIMRY